MRNNEERRTKNEKGQYALISFFVICYSLFPALAQADIVVFKNGRTMSVSSFKVVADMARIVLRAGGDVTFPASMVERVDPDEVPYLTPGTGSREPFDSPDRHRREDAPVRLAQGKPLVQAPELVPDEVLAARPFADLISSVAAAHDVDARLVHAVIEQESNYQARARSKKGARGLMQLMPATARQYGVANSYDPQSNLEAGVRHLQGLLSRLELPLALAAYNAGEATIRRCGGLPPFPETQSYVRNILRRVRR